VKDRGIGFVEQIETDEPIDQSAVLGTREPAEEVEKALRFITIHGVQLAEKPAEAHHEDKSGGNPQLDCAHGASRFDLDDRRPSGSGSWRGRT
jgi:hypothetical protein